MKSTQNLKKIRNLSHRNHGIDFGNRKAVQFKITHKDVILVAGILVALIIVAITTWMMDNQSEAESKRLFPIPKVNPAVFHTISNTIQNKF